MVELKNILEDYTVSNINAIFTYQLYKKIILLVVQPSHSIEN